MAAVDIDSVRTPLSFIVILVLGAALQLKKQTVQHVLGFQQVILSCLLPSLLYKSVVGMSLAETRDPWVFPFIALIFSFVLGFASLPALMLSGFGAERRQRSTLMMMLPGLAPGLTSLPYIEAVVEDVAPHTMTTGHAGLADIGVKVFVLFILYLAAAALSAQTERKNRKAIVDSMGTDGAVEAGAPLLSMLGSLAYQFATEPVNVASILGLILLLAGPVPLEDQFVWGDAVRRLAKCCTPAIFLLIGIKLKCPKRQHLGLLALLVFRAGVSLAFVAVLRAALGLQPDEVMFWIFFCCSAVSFWPYTHMVSFSAREEASLRQHCASVLCNVARGGDLPEAAAEELERASEELRSGTTDAAASVALAKKHLAAAPPSGPVCGAVVAIEAMEEIGRTFDMPLALMLLTVSFTWTITLCTVISFTPASFWIAPAALPVSAVTLTLIGFGSLLGMAFAEWRKEQAEAESLAQVRAAAGHDKAFAPRPSKRLSIVSGAACDPAAAPAQLDELTVYEADAALRRISVGTADLRTSVRSSVSRLSMRPGTLPAASVAQPRTSEMADWALRRSLPGGCVPAGADLDLKRITERSQESERRPSVSSFAQSATSNDEPSEPTTLLRSIATQGAGGPQADDKKAYDPVVASDIASAEGSVLSAPADGGCSNKRPSDRASPAGPLAFLAQWACHWLHSVQ